MDPDETLKCAREALEILNCDLSFEPARLDASDDLVAAFEALDEWLSKGGFLPADWAKVSRSSAV